MGWPGSQESRVQILRHIAKTLLVRLSRPLPCALLLALATPTHALAENDSGSSIDHLLARIERQENLTDSYAPELGELYFSLGRALANQNAHLEALDAYRTAMQIERINQGLNAISQTPYLFAVADSHYQLGERERATDALYALYNLAIKYHGEESEELIPTLDRLLDWQLRAYRLSEPRAGFKHLVDADKIAAHQLSLLIARGNDADISSDMTSYRRVIEVNYTVAEHIKQHGLPSESGFSVSMGASIERTPSTHTQSSYRNGKMALEQIILRIERSEQTDREALAKAIARLGDWYLVFGQHSSAEQAYQLAYQVTYPIDSSAENPDSAINDEVQLEHRSELGEQLFNSPQAILFLTLDASWSRQNLSVEVDKKGRITAVEWSQVNPAIAEKKLQRALKLANQVRYRPRIDQTGSRDSVARIALAINPELVELLSTIDTQSSAAPPEEQTDAEDTTANTL